MLSDTVFYAGDFNADLLDQDKSTKDGRSLLDLLDIFDLNCLINKATRKTKTTETLLDLILTNKTRTLTSGVVDTQISDHSLVFTVLRSVAPRSRSRKICFRSLKNFNHEKFVQDLHMAPFSIIMNLFDDVNDKLFTCKTQQINAIWTHFQGNSADDLANQKANSNAPRVVT